MERALITTLCLLSCVMVVNGYFTGVAVGQVTNYMFNNVMKGAWPDVPIPQHAYVVKLTAEECQRDPANQNYVNNIPMAFFTAINQEIQENQNAIRNAMKANEIYTGNRIILASFKDVIINNKILYTEHAEYRLLFPAPGQKVSPMENFLNQQPKAHCVVFFSLLSPCVDRCINQNGPYNILKSLEANFGKLQDKAFAFTKPNEFGDKVLSSWANLNGIMPLYRCIGATGQRCFLNTGKDVDFNPFCIAN